MGGERERFHDFGVGDDADALRDDARGVPGKRTLVEHEGLHEDAEAGVAGGGGPLPFLAQIQASFGAHDVSGVRAHTDDAAASASRAMGAQAFAFGNRVAFGGTPSLHTAAHEAAHVVQQRSGVHLKGGVGAAGDAYEQHADAVADAVVSGRSAQGLLDRYAGNGGGAPAIQRKDDTSKGAGPNSVKGGGAAATPAQSKNFAVLSAMKMSDFVAYSDTQADWSMAIPNAGQQTDLRDLMAWLRGADHRRTALGNFLVSEGIAHKGDLAALDAYARAKGTAKSVAVTMAATIVDAIDMGKDLVKLEGALQQPVLHQIFPLADRLGKNSFQRLRDAAAVDGFVTYVNACKPMLQANNGAEIISFVTFFGATGGNPTMFIGLKDVRSYHKFEVAALVTLQVHLAGNVAKLPFTLILHSAIDWNGAFHQDPEMTAAIVKPANHTYMIEGAASLAEISGRIPALVALHGRDENDAKTKKTVKRIDQVMIAGHGDSHSIELGGDYNRDKAGKIKADSDGSIDMHTGEDSLDVSGDPKKAKQKLESEKFLKDLMPYMSADPATPHGRIVFNACLTASNDVDPDAFAKAKTPADQAKVIQKSIANSPSIVEETRKVAKANGRGALDVRGGNGSFGVVGLMDNTGALDIVADGTGKRGLDPELTNPDKLVYAEKGVDPQGCLSAVLESWAKDKAKTITAIKNRRGAPVAAGTWDEDVIQALYEIIETRHSNDGASIAVAASVADGFKELDNEGASRVWTMWRLGDTKDWAILEKKLKPRGEWTGQPFVPMVFYQGWQFIDAAKRPDFLAALGAMTVESSMQTLNIGAFTAHWTTYVPAVSPAVPDPGTLRLVLRDLNDNGAGAQPNTKAFLGSLVDKVAHKFKIDVKTPMGSLGDEDTVLTALGLSKAQAAGGAAPPPKFGPAPKPDANVDMDVDGTNDSAVQPMAATGRVTPKTLPVHDQPRVAGDTQAKVLAQNALVPVMGKVETKTGGKWYLIDNGGARGYVQQGLLVLV
ncbi:MAG TPA: DUF4157 domain-containing protein [Kofleriaceae bacterium]|jgi:hypothetical protein